MFRQASFQLVAALAVSVAPAWGQSSAPTPSASIGAAYPQLARAYENADEALLRTLLAPDFSFVYVAGTSESVAQYVEDWQETKSSSPARVAFASCVWPKRGRPPTRRFSLRRHFSTTRTPRWTCSEKQIAGELRNGAWALVSARTISDAVSIDGNVITSDRPGQPLTAPQRAAVAAQLKKDAWAIDTAVPGGNQRDLEPLYAAIGPARVVGLGEATHGTSEFFSLKDRIFRFLVEKMGFTVFAMETPWQSGLVIDRYVTTSEGDPHAALAGTFAVWDNQEVLDLIEWIPRTTSPAVIGPSCDSWASTCKTIPAR